MANIKDFATALIATAPSPANSGTSLVLQAGKGARMPAVPFAATIHPEGEIPTLDNAEKVNVTNVVADTLTIQRAQGETTARNIGIGWRISNAIFASDLDLSTYQLKPSEGAFVNGDKTKLDGIESGAQVNTVTSVNTRTGAVTGLAEASDLTAHTSNTSNPHSVTKAQVGLGNADNTSDADKPVSTAQAAADALKVNKAGDTMTGALTTTGIVQTSPTIGISSGATNNALKLSGGTINDGGTIVLSGSTGANTGILRIGSTDIAYWSTARLSPNSNNTIALGSPTQSWSNVYATQATIGGVLYITGTGFPNGVVSAPVGSIYIDTAITNGASSWIKKSGTGNTGWQVLEGDTGWRRLATLGAFWSSGYVDVRRIGYSVYIRILSLKVAASPTGNRIVSKSLTDNNWPDGFKYSTVWGVGGVNIGQVSVNGFPGKVGNMVTAHDLGVSVYISGLSSTGTWTADDSVDGCVTYSTIQGWPSTLPGTAA